MADRSEDLVRPYVVVNRAHAEAIFPNWDSLAAACGSATEEMEGPVVLRIHKPRLRDKGRHRFTFEAIANANTLSVWWSSDESAIKALKGDP